MEYAFKYALLESCFYLGKNAPLRLYQLHLQLRCMSIHPQYNLRLASIGNGLTLY